MRNLFILIVIIVIGICGVATISCAQDLYDQKFQIGVHGGTFLGDGEPTNDLPAVGIYGRYSYHFADWEMKDRVSGKSDSIDNYSTWGFYFGLGFRF